MKSKAAKTITNGGTVKTKLKEDRKRPKSMKSEEDGAEPEHPAKIAKLKKDKKKKPSEEHETEKENNTPNNGLKLSDINKAVFPVFKRLQNSTLSQKTINSLVVLLRDDTNDQQVRSKMVYIFNLV